VLTNILNKFFDLKDYVLCMFKFMPAVGLRLCKTKKKIVLITCSIFGVFENRGMCYKKTTFVAAEEKSCRT